jgi:hypothetical protein
MMEKIEAFFYLGITEKLVIEEEKILKKIRRKSLGK